MPSQPPFAAFAPPIRHQSSLRKAITAAYRRGEAQCLAPLLPLATPDEPTRGAIRHTARQLVEKLRAGHKGSGVEGLVREYSLSSDEGVALMCLAEALLRIPDDATRDALIRDKIADGDWEAHLGGSRSLFVNAATWGLVITGKLTASVDDRRLGVALTRLVARAGEPVIRRGVDFAMRMIGEQFVLGETIELALKRARRMEAKGFRYSFDMLGEAASTAVDADRYYQDYEDAIHAIGQASNGQGVYERPGISIKLSALHPRYSRAQAGRVMAELLPRLRDLAILSKHYDIGLNIDAEEADRLELSLDLLESLASDKDLEGWDGLGFVVQAYGKRCPYVIDWIIDLARRAGRRLMVRLVKGAYWDAEIKRTQIEGLVDFPVYTRKVHTDLAYIACAHKLLDAPDAVFPQFATHNAQTLASIYHLAGPIFEPGDYEFQCLHGMGEPLYEEVVGTGKLDRPCRIYAPVGTHETLLAYLVRRLLENGANSSFVNRIADPAISIEELIADPVEIVKQTEVTPNALIASPGALYPYRLNSSGIDLSDEDALAELGEALRQSASISWQAEPMIPGLQAERSSHAVINPADHKDVVGHAAFALEEDAVLAAQTAAKAAPQWATVPVDVRADILESAADLLGTQKPLFLGLLVREAGKSVSNAIAEVREAIDLLRYYAVQAQTTLGADQTPLGPVVCVSPWNFPLAIFTGQIAAALAAGNPVLAKPAEETPLIAAEVVRLLHQAGIPRDVLQLLPGDGRIGAALIAAPETSAVMFTGSTEVARMIQRQLASRLSPAGKPIPLIAETGGQNAMIVDSSALAEQVVADAMASAFDSAGQRCSALRILCIQEEVADRTLDMLKGALHELRVGRTDVLSADVGPVITAEAAKAINTHIEGMRALGCAVHQQALPAEAMDGTFVPPTIIEIDDLSYMQQEIFGPVLHVMRFRREQLSRLIDDINAMGYGLTFGLHTRLDKIIDRVTERIKAGNIYVNRNVIGAVVGSQPFGGCGLSGTGPKAGGPLYLNRLVSAPPLIATKPQELSSNVLLFAAWLDARGERDAAQTARLYGVSSAAGISYDLPGPTGERNIYSLHPRGRILLRAETKAGLFMQMAAVIATGNKGLVQGVALPPDLPTDIAALFRPFDGRPCAAALVEGDAEQVAEMVKEAAEMPGAIMSVHAADTTLPLPYHPDWLLEEVAMSINTAAAGGNASLMMIG